jgi:hypothetical protein
MRERAGPQRQKSCFYSARDPGAYSHYVGLRRHFSRKTRLFHPYVVAAHTVGAAWLNRDLSITIQLKHNLPEDARLQVRPRKEKRPAS